MQLEGMKFGFGLTGSHCTFQEIMAQLKRLVEEGAEVYPIASPSVMNTDTRFGTAKTWIEEIESITNRKVVSTIVGAETFGPKIPLDRRYLKATT